MELGIFVFCGMVICGAQPRSRAWMWALSFVIVLMCLWASFSAVGWTARDTYLALH